MSNESVRNRLDANSKVEHYSETLLPYVSDCYCYKQNNIFESYMLKSIICRW